jgi:hypothetical protein
VSSLENFVAIAKILDIDVGVFLVFYKIVVMKMIDNTHKLPRMYAAPSPLALLRFMAVVRKSCAKNSSIESLICFNKHKIK